PVVQARSADHQRRGDQRCLVSISQQFACLGVRRAATHSPNTFFRISISNCLRPSARSSCLTRLDCSSSAPPAALLPPSAAFAPCSASSRQRYHRLGATPCLRHVSAMFPLFKPSCRISHFSSALRFTCSLRPMLPPLRRPLSYSLQVSSFRGVHYTEDLNPYFRQEFIRLVEVDREIGETANHLCRTHRAAAGQK